MGLAHVPILVTVAEDQPTLRLWARLVHKITDPAVALREMNILNRDATQVRFHVKHDALWVSCDLHCAPFVPRHFQLAVTATAEAARGAAEDFAVRAGGSV